MDRTPTSLSRRDFLKMAGVTGAALGAGGGVAPQIKVQGPLEKLP